jgi:hypothetical protein
MGLSLAFIRDQACPIDFLDSSWALRSRLNYLVITRDMVRQLRLLTLLRPFREVRVMLRPLLWPILLSMSYSMVVERRHQ